MNRALRIIIPIMLCIVLLCFSAWYLLIYDQDFTRDFLLSQARNLERSGNHKLSTWLYDVCYYQSQHNDDVAIELARQYVAAGNYTKAEYTLSKAISNRTSEKLYAALCSVYVEQDKLLDAVNLLDSITDPSIKAKLDSQRPAAPTVSHAPGFYNQYITLTMESPNAELYVSVDGEYPSIENGKYTDPIVLPNGETVIYAVSVDENNLVSPLSLLGYTIGSVVEEVEFTDPAIEAAIRSILTVSDSETLFSDDLWSITSFTVPENAKSLDDLRHMIYLHSLTAEHTVTGLQSLSKLTALNELVLRNCNLSAEDISAIGQYTSLTSLTLENCSLSTVTPLAGLVELTALDLSGNAIRNLQALSDMQKLTTLDLSENVVVDLADISNLTNLSSLDVSANALTSLSPIFTDNSITTLKAANNQIASIVGIGELKNLGILDLSQNQLTDISDLAGCSKLVELNISNNTVSDISCLYNMLNLTTLNFAHNIVKELPPFVPESVLVTIDGSNNQLSSVEALSGLPQLNNVLLDYNEKLSSLQPLDDCPLLILVNAYGTKVSNVTFLTDKDVLVNFNPSR